MSKFLKLECFTFYWEHFSCLWTSLNQFLCSACYFGIQMSTSAGRVRGKHFRRIVKWLFTRFKWSQDVLGVLETTEGILSMSFILFCVLSRYKYAEIFHIEWIAILMFDWKFPYCLGKWKMMRQCHVISRGLYMEIFVRVSCTVGLLEKGKIWLNS